MEVSTTGLLPLVSIVIPNWNGASLLEECLSALVSTTYHPIEIIVVDNNSSDDSLRILQGFKTVKVVRSSANLGYAAGCNLGISESRGDFIVTLNNDIVVRPDWLASPIEHLLVNDEIGIVSCRQMNYYDRKKVDALFQVFEKHLLLGRYGNGRLVKDIPDALYPGYVIGANGASAIYRRRMLDEIGAFDERFFAYHEECDLCMRAFERGYKCLYVPNAVVYHKGSVSFDGVKKVFYYLHERNRIWFIYKHFPMPVILYYLPIILLRMVRTFTNIALARRMPQVFFAAIKDGFQKLREYGEERQFNLRLFHKQWRQFNLLKRKRILRL